MELEWFEKAKKRRREMEATVEITKVDLIKKKGKK